MKGLEEHWDSHCGPEECVSSLYSCGGHKWVFTKGFSKKTPQAFLQLIFTKKQTKGLVLTKDQNCDKNHWILAYTKTWRFSKLKWSISKERKEVHLFLRSLQLFTYFLLQNIFQFVQTVPQKRSTGQTMWSHNTTENRKCVFKRVYWTEKEKDR